MECPPPEQFVEETVDLSRRYSLDMLWIVDDNFLVDLDRARGIAEGWARRHPQLLSFCEAADRMVSRWPAFNVLGDHMLLHLERV